MARKVGGRTAGLTGRSRLAFAVWAGGVLPALLLAWRFASDDLGADPVAAALNQLGLLALILLLISLACTPIRIVTKQAWPIQVRRALGLLGFGYATLHVATYLILDQGLAVRSILLDLTKRPFTIAGALAWLLLLPLALTSSKKALQQLGAVKWRRIHRLVYVSACLAILHFVLRVKKDVTEPVIYGAVLAVLLGIRVVDTIRRRRATAAALAD